MIRWEICEADFRSDGSLRDIYITRSTLEDWRLLYPFLRDYPDAEYMVDGIAHPIPNSVDEVFFVRSSGCPMLRLRVGRALIVFHFFDENEIECDFSPNEITSQADLDTLLVFIRQLGEMTHKPVAITQENSPDLPFIIYAPERKMFELQKNGRAL
jgi:hypothetical protein